MPARLVWRALVMIMIGLAAQVVPAQMPTAYACKCASPGITPDDAFARAEVVFIGRVTSVEHGDNRQSTQARVEVLESRKGGATGEVTVWTIGGDSCGFEMHPEGVYLLHSSWIRGTVIGTYACIGNQMLVEGVRPTPFTLQARRANPKPLNQAAWELFAPILAVFGVLGAVAVALWMTTPSARRRS